MQRKRGVTLVEAIIGTAILGLVFTFVIGVFVVSADRLTRSKMRILGTALANEQMETVRNLPYDQVGTTTGVPSGNIPGTQTMVRSNVGFTVATRIDWVDDPFDGLVTGTTPIDTIPTDYKKVQVIITWPSGTASVKLTSTITPKGLEAPSNTGSLLMTVRDASGTAVPEADVTVTNTNLVPNVNIVTTTDVNGKLQLLGLTPDLNNYHIVVTKAGYTIDGTQPVSAGNPYPKKPDLSIIANSVTPASYYIDRVSSLAISTKDNLCQPVPNISFNLKGQNLIGYPPPPPPVVPPVLKYDVDHTTDINGNITINNLEWDNYTLTLNGTVRNIIGLIPPASLNVLPNTNANLTLVLSDTYSANSLLANVKDANTGLPVSGASVQLTGTNGTTLTTGQGAWNQTDWSGGSGQGDFMNATKYESDDGNVEVTGTVGQVELKKSTVATSTFESFTDTTYKDVTATTADWDSSNGEVKLPQTGGVYDPSAIAQSLKLNTPAGKIVSATLTVSDQPNGETIHYYLTADGVNFEEVTSGAPHTFIQSGSDLRFKITLATADSSKTPSVQQIDLQLTVESYASSGILTSSSFNTGTASSFIILTWNPESQTAQVGAEAVRFQLAANDDNATWDFVGPDGTDTSYYTVSGTPVAAAIQNKQYIKYKLFLQTDDQAATPGVSNVAVSYTSGCTAPGQVFFPDLAVETYGVTISKTGYNTLVTIVDINGNVQNTFNLVPN
jgi:type II secretory pathway pseudopilin PulG